MQRILAILLLLSALLTVSPVVAQDTVFDDLDNILNEYRRELRPLDRFLDEVESPRARIPVFGIGLALLLAGHALFTLIVFLQGFFLGAGIGVVVDNDTILGAFVSGAIGGFIALLLYMLAIFVSGFVLGFLLGGGLMALMTDEPVGDFLMMAVIAGIVGGFVALWLQKLVEILFSSAVGTALIGVATGIGDSGWLLIVLFVIGVAVQYGWLLRHNPESLKPGFKDDKPWWERKRAAAPGKTVTITAGNLDSLADTQPHRAAGRQVSKELSNDIQPTRTVGSH